MFADWVGSQTGHSQRSQQLDFWFNSLLIDNISGSSAPFQAAAMNELSSRDWQLEPLELLAPNLFSTQWCNNPWCKAPVCVRSRRSVWLPAALKDLWAEADCLDYSRVETAGLGPGIITARSGRQQPWRSLRLYKRLTACKLDFLQLWPSFVPPSSEGVKSSGLLMPCHCRNYKFDMIYALAVKWLFGKHNFNFENIKISGDYDWF